MIKIKDYRITNDLLQDGKIFLGKSLFAPIYVDANEMPDLALISNYNSKALEFTKMVLSSVIYNYSYFDAIILHHLDKKNIFNQYEGLTPNIIIPDSNNALIDLFKSIETVNKKLIIVIMQRTPFYNEERKIIYQELKRIKRLKNVVLIHEEIDGSEYNRGHKQLYVYNNLLTILFKGETIIEHNNYLTTIKVAENEKKEK